jgi:TPR repeat protein
MFNLGCKLYEKGEKKEGISWFIKAAKDGHAKAYYYLGVILEGKNNEKKSNHHNNIPLSNSNNNIDYLSLAKLCYVQSAKYGCKDAQNTLIDLNINIETCEEKDNKIFEESTYL